MTQSIGNYLCRKSFLAAAFLVMSGCAGNGEGLDSGGRPIEPPAANDDFQEIQSTIFTPVCSVCHSGANAPQGLRLDAGNSYAALVNVASNEVPTLMRVNPGNPDTSYIVHKIQGNAAVGSRMPANGPPFLSQAQIDLIRGWIAAGAPQASAPTDRLFVSSSMPAPSEQALAGLNRITVVFNTDVDASRVSANSFELRDALDQPGRPGADHGSARTADRGRDRDGAAVTRGQLPARSPRRRFRAARRQRRSPPRRRSRRPGRGDTLIPFDVNAGAAR